MRGHNAKAIRWGVMGCGGIADRRTIPEGIIPSEDSKLVAVESRSEGTAKRIAKKYGIGLMAKGIKKVLEHYRR